MRSPILPYRTYQRMYATIMQRGGSRGSYMPTVTAAILATFLCSCGGTTRELPRLQNQIDSVSYGMGMDIGKRLRQQDAGIDPDIMAAGMLDVIEGRTTLLTEQELPAVMDGFHAFLETRAEERARLNLEREEMFLAENGKKEGVTTLENGLQYLELTPGTGPAPGDRDNVQVQYRGTLQDGTVFDDTAERGPASFALSTLIPGWQEALRRMKVGARWRIFVPSRLAYGREGSGSIIGPNELLIFDIELLGIN